MSENNERFLDFDTMFAEMKREPVVIRVYGEEHELPPSLPAIIMLRILRLMETGEEAEVPPTEILTLANAIFGESRLLSWANRGLDVEQMGLMIKQVSAIYSARQRGESNPNQKAPRKSGRGGAQ